MGTKPAYRSPRIWALCLGLWIVLGALNAGSEVIDVVTGDADHAYWEPVTWEMSSNLTFALLAPFLIELALRVRVSSVGAAAAIPLHAAAMVVFSLLHVGGMVGLRKAVYAAVGRSYDFGPLGWELLYEGFKDSITYATIVGLTYGVDYYRRYRERELQAFRLQASLAQARLENLEHRLQPHFLFNTLNMISATMHEDVGLADRMITRLSDLLRLSVRQRGRQEVTLAEELDLLDAYLEIMRTRFEQRLQVDLHVGDGLRDALVPPLLLQPLVENAIRHGLEGRGGGRIEVGIGREGARLSLSVRDDGPGAGGVPAESLLLRGVGLSATAERLQRLYGEEGRLQVHNGASGGLRLDITIPLRIHAAGTDAEALR